MQVRLVVTVRPLPRIRMADFLNIFAALEQDDCETIDCNNLDSNDDVILVAAVACFMRTELTRVNGYSEPAERICKCWGGRGGGRG